MPKKSTLPLIEPVRVRNYTGPRWDWKKPGWTYQIKYDGFRGLLYKDQGSCRILSKEKNDLGRWWGSFDVLCKSIAQQLNPKEVILDGEVVALDERGRPDFMALIEAKKPLAYVVFDVLWLNGMDLRPKLLTDRLEILRVVGQQQSRTLQIAEWMMRDNVEMMFQALCAHDLEGMVAKRLEDPYTKYVHWYRLLNPHYSLRERKRALFARAHKK